MTVISMVGVGAGLVLVLPAVTLHHSKDTGRELTVGITQKVLECRVTTAAETDFPKPINRSIGGDGGVAAVRAGEEGAELEGEETEEEQSPTDMPEGEVEYSKAELVKRGETIKLVSNETVLNQDEDVGMDFPYVYRQGFCVSCVTKITDSLVEEYIMYHIQETLSDEEIDNGYMLTCVAYPEVGFIAETGEAP